MSQLQAVVDIVAVQEELFFGPDADGVLRQWLSATIDNPSSQPQPAHVEIRAGSERAQTDLTLLAGVHGYRCFAPVLWPDRERDGNGEIVVTTGSHECRATVTVGTVRPWTVYLLSDMCTDYTWVFDQDELTRTYDAAVTMAELEWVGATRGRAEHDRNHYNFVHTREVEFFLEKHPADADLLFTQIQQGALTLNPFFNMAATGNMSLEELIRQFYPARRLAHVHGLDIRYANHQETPTITWAMATVLAGCGIPYLVKAILPYQCPWAKRLEEPPLFAWEGPDGSRIWVRRRNVNYVEGNFVLRDLRTTNAALHDAILPSYHARGADYPFDAVALLGCYGDLSATSAELPAKKVETISVYNAQNWTYPRLVNASHQQFWDHIEANVSERSLSLPVFRGDYGTAWEAWVLSLAHDFAGWRRAQERAGAADKLAVIAAHLDPAWLEQNASLLEEGWRHLLYLADHAWNGSNDSNRRLNAALRRCWQETANRLFDCVIANGLQTLTEHIHTQSSPHILVFNSLPWTRTALVPLHGIHMDAQLGDVTTGRALPVQVRQTATGPTLYVLIEDLPSVGYKLIALLPDDGPREAAAISFSHGDTWLDGPSYRLELDPATGAVRRLFDKVRGRELVDTESPYLLNQCVYWCDGVAAVSPSVEHTQRRAEIRIGELGSLFGEVVVDAWVKNLRLTTTYTLYAHLDRIDICNEVEKTSIGEKEEMAFVFPFAVPDRHYRVETPGAIMEPGREQLPGAGQAITAVRHFVDVFNDEFGVTLSMTDSGFVEFGHRTSMEDPEMPDPANSTVLAMALGNWINWREVTRDQGGQTGFVFRYSLQGHDGGFDPVQALRFGWEDNNPPETIVHSHEGSGPLPGDRHSFITVQPQAAVLSCLKLAEEEGLIARLWSCTSKAVEAEVTVDGLGALKSARQTDHLERDQRILDVNSGHMHGPLAPRGIASYRLLLA